jgi:hypothetical protein
MSSQIIKYRKHLKKCIKIRGILIRNDNSVNKRPKTPKRRLLKNLIILVRKTGLEPVRQLRHYPLKIACIPISPLPQKDGEKI